MEPVSGNYAKPKNRTFYISTIVSISLVLLMVGLLGLIVVHAKNLSNYVKENIVLSIIVAENANEAEVIQLQKTLQTYPYVKSSEYVSKDMAAKNLEKDMGEDFVKFLGYNPLLSSIDVYLKAEYANNETIARIKTELQQNPLVKEVYYQESLVDLINQNLSTISLIILVFAGTLLLIAIALINNTIRLSMHSQRFIIRSMQLVGATKSFIRWPFVLTGILNGFLGALVSIILLIIALFFAQREVPELVILQNYYEFAMVFLTVVLTGIIISWISTHFAVNKYLNSKTSDIY